MIHSQPVQVNRRLSPRSPTDSTAAAYRVPWVLLAVLLALIAWAAAARAGEVFFEAEISVRNASEELSAAGLDSPLFAVTLVYEPASMQGRTALFVRHVSSIPNTEDKAGLNELGWRTRFKLD